MKTETGPGIGFSICIKLSTQCAIYFLHTHAKHINSNFNQEKQFAGKNAARFSGVKISLNSGFRPR